MEYISATEARICFSDLIDKAGSQPIIIQRQNKDVAVIISPKEYEKLRRMKLKELDDICRRASLYAKKQGLTEKKLAELLADES